MAFPVLLRISDVAMIVSYNANSDGVDRDDTATKHILWLAFLHPRDIFAQSVAALTTFDYGCQVVLKTECPVLRVFRRLWHRER